MAYQKKMLQKKFCTGLRNSNTTIHSEVDKVNDQLLQLEWDKLSQPPYSPDLAPFNYYFFRFRQFSLDGKTFTSNEDIKYHSFHLFVSNKQKFYEH